MTHCCIRRDGGHFLFADRKWKFFRGVFAALQDESEGAVAGGEGKDRSSDRPKSAWSDVVNALTLVAMSATMRVSVQRTRRVASDSYGGYSGQERSIFSPFTWQGQTMSRLALPRRERRLFIAADFPEGALDTSTFSASGTVLLNGGAQC